METIKDKAAIVGIGLHRFSKDSHMTEWDMACRSTLAALDDCGLTPPDIDCIVEYNQDDFDQQHLARAMGMGNIAYFGDSTFGSGAACAGISRAASAVASGAVNNAVFVRAVNDSSKQRSTIRITELPAAEALNNDFHEIYGLAGFAGKVAMSVRRYMHEYGIDSNKFGWVTTVCREHGAKNPNSIFFNQPPAFADYLKSKVVVEPLRALDCAPEIDGSIAFVITTVERAKRLKQRPVYIMAGAQSMTQGSAMMTSYYRPAISALEEIGIIGKRLFEVAGVKHRDIDVVELDDTFAPLVPMQLEALGFCEPGEGASFCAGGSRIRAGGELPLNTGGGALGEGQIYGLNHIYDAVCQLRGTSPNQVKDAETVLIATGAGGPASGLILRR